MTHHFQAVWEAADSWDKQALIALVLAAIGQAFFVTEYAQRPWWRHFVGRALFYKSAVIGIVLWLSVVNTFITFPGQEQVSAILLDLTALVIWYQAFVIRKTPRHVYPPDDRHDEPPAPLQ